MAAPDYSKLFGVLGEPNRGSQAVPEIERKIQEGPLAKALLTNWLTTKGVPAKSAAAATINSLALAYCVPNYRRSWVNRVNPNWNLISGNDDDDEEAEDKAEAEKRLNTAIAAQTSPTAKPSSPPTEVTTALTMDRAQAQAWLTDLYKQMEATTDRLIAEKLRNTKLVLDEAAKAEIRSLATSAAKAYAEANAVPRTIEIADKSSGEIRSLGLQHEKFSLLLRAVGARDHRGFRLNIWLTGPTGSGKTSACEAVAKALNLPFGSDGSLDADYKVLGFRNAQGEVVSTQFLDIYENGGIYVADEIDNWLPSALLSLNAALANGWVSSPRGLVKRHPNACVIACANTWGLGATNDYVGRTKLDAASLDRFHPKIDWPVDEKMERAVAELQGGTIGLAWHKTILAARQAARRQGLKIIVSPRSTFNGIALLLAGFEENEVIDMTFAAGLSPEQRRAIPTINQVDRSFAA